jgi:heme/copper-type cytochrome/quinol oxidase subunit 3
MEASAPIASHIEPEPNDWQPRALWMGGRLLCGSVAFFFMAFLFAYFYLRSLNPNHAWKLGAVNPSMGLGLIIMAALLLSGMIFRLTARRPADMLAGGIVAIVLAIIALVLQVVEWTTLGFGTVSGGYASVFIGWTIAYAVFMLFGIYWIETQIASLWRARRAGVDRPVREGVPAAEVDLLQAGVEAASFYWAFFVGTGVLAYIVLYLV